MLSAGTVVAAGLLAVFVGATRTHPVAVSDSGAYLSVERLLLRGHHLYTGVFDNKDPLFYYVNAIALAVAGPRGPALAEVAALAAAGSAACWFLVRRDAPVPLALVVAAAVPVVLTPSMTSGLLIPGLTHTWGLTATLLAVLALLERRWVLGGVLCATSALFEFRTVAIGAVVALILVAVSVDDRRRAGLRFTLGFASIAVAAIGVLLIRGELGGYIAVFRYNLHHVSMVREWQQLDDGWLPATALDGLRRAFREVPVLVVSVGAVLAMAAIGCSGPFLARRLDRRRADPSGAVEPAAPASANGTGSDRSSATLSLSHTTLGGAAVLAAGATTVGVTSVTYLFLHHLQLLAMPTALGLVLLADAVRSRPAWPTVGALAVMAPLVVALGQPWNLMTRLDGWHDNLGSPAATAIMSASGPGRHVYAIAGDVQFETAHAEFLENRFTFSCRLIYQHPWDETMFDEFAHCLATEPDVILYTEYFGDLQNRFATYRSLRLEVERILSECFELAQLDPGSVNKVYVRRSGCVATSSPIEKSKETTVSIAIAGAGFSGAVLARELAEAGLDVEVFDPRPHVAGNSHTARHRTGVMVHVYGPHIFHTRWEHVWEYVQRFDTMRPYRHRVMARVGGRIFSLPVNLLTINQFFGTTMSPSEARAFVAARCETSTNEPRTVEEQGLRSVGRELYEAFFAGYTEKQWGCPPAELPASVLKRLPVRFTYDDSYFDHPFQGIPQDGYTALVARMLDHPAITMHLDQALDGSCVTSFEHVFWTAPIDQFFGASAGRLAYRTLDFQCEEYVGDHQGCAVLNYCDVETPFTRTTEFQHFAPWEEHERSVVFREFSRAAEPGDIPYYPVRLSEDTSLLSEYLDRAHATTGVSFVGRLGTYRYLDMDVSIKEALDAARCFLTLRSAGERAPAFFIDPLS